jgi:hypothetical protein
MLDDEIGRAARRLQYFEMDEVAAFQGLFMLSPQKHEELVDRLSTEQRRMLLRMIWESGCVTSTDAMKPECAEILYDFDFLMRILQEKMTCEKKG